MNGKKIYGLTGMSGAGKTTVCEEFSRSGFDIINCDMIAREVVEKDTPCLDEIKQKFGGEVITADGELDRKVMGNIVFNDKAKLLLLNNTIYPYITYEVIQRIERSDSGYVLLDAPTLFESGIDYICDGVVSVICDREISLKRIMARDGIDRKAAESRLKSQHDAEFYKSRSDFCIENNGDFNTLTQTAQKVIQQIKGEI